MTPRRLIVGISGATGIAYGVRLLERLRTTGIETHLVVTRSADITRSQETVLSAEELRTLATVNHSITDIGAAIASGSFRTMGMVVAPCSVRTLSEIATGVTSSLLTRAADVCLKERRRLLLLFRETPLHAGHLRSMLAAHEAGAIIMPPVPAFYTHPASISEIVDHTVARIMDLFDIEVETSRWTGLSHLKEERKYRNGHHDGSGKSNGGTSAPFQKLAGIPESA